MDELQEIYQLLDNLPSSLRSLPIEGDDNVRHALWVALKGISAIVEASPKEKDTAATLQFARMLIGIGLIAYSSRPEPVPPPPSPTAPLTPGGTPVRCQVCGSIVKNP
jgi:hypothetical protein